MAEAQRLYGEISPYYLERCLEVVQGAIAKFGRVFALRVDLRFAQDTRGGEYDMPICFQRNDPKAITRFIEALKSQIKADHKRKGRSGEPAYPLYIWVREQVGSGHWHYHLVLFFKKDVYGFRGDYSNSDADNMATRVQRAWCSALGLVYPDYAPLVQFPQNGSYLLDQRSLHLKPEYLHHFLLRLAYFCKTHSKDIGDGQRNMGCSQV
ncbi:inovirus Gp2 family protein [Aeromonas rivipollensis]|uniref:Inovirus Gp2 family protein n=1 Tax=Aeromonas rivipollensis TaxID=948519 RepID=A0AAW9YDS8_9GAMM|nr:inovirus Gp2 family protein [Aeromonas rivipollensis]NEX75959.1 inovirus Gp2 family protein [Aeromonas rivipollensis]